MSKNNTKGFFLATAVVSVSLLLPMIESANAADEKISFFITSIGPGDGANLGGLAGADAHCVKLAEAEGIKGKDWAAYLSTFGQGAMNARDRIGTGPWYNSKGVMVGKDLEHLHSQDTGLGKDNSLDEKGAIVNGKGDKPNRHDILTGSQANGMAINGLNMTCDGWTANGAEGYAQVGHHDRIGGGPNPKAWNSAHPSKGCSQEILRSTGGDGLFYCFAK